VTRPAFVIGDGPVHGRCPGARCAVFEITHQTRA
jgi:hypothetical protein